MVIQLRHRLDPLLTDPQQIDGEVTKAAFREVRAAYNLARLARRAVPVRVVTEGPPFLH